MRIRLRVPTDGGEKSSGPRGWFQRLRDSFDGAAQNGHGSGGVQAKVLAWLGSLFRPSAANEARPGSGKPRRSMLHCDLRRSDKRWITRGDAKYFFEGRRCRNTCGAWQSEYVFSVLTEGEPRKVRVVLPEGPIADWEKRHGQRMTEDRRLRLACDTMEALLDLHRCPAAITVPAATVAAVPVT
jgi:hypothetical protein